MIEEKRELMSVGGYRGLERELIELKVEIERQRVSDSVRKGEKEREMAREKSAKKNAQYYS